MRSQNAGLSPGLGEQVQLLVLEGELRCGALPAGACLLVLASRPASSTSGPTLTLQHRPVLAHRPAGNPAFLPACLGERYYTDLMWLDGRERDVSHRFRSRGCTRGWGGIFIGSHLNARSRPLEGSVYSYISRFYPNQTDAKDRARHQTDRFSLVLVDIHNWTLEHD